jgi:glycosyltransferase involved in cell wall biosynthesis
MLLRRHAYRLVVSSGPPHSCHVAAAAAVRGRGVPYWVDMRDPWIGRGDVEDRRAGLIQSLAARLERWVFRTGALVLTNSSPYAAGLRDVYPGLVVETIPNGVDVEKLPAGPPPEPYPEVTLAHVGTIYLKRDVGTVVSAIRRAQELRGGPPARLRLVGSVAEPYRTQVLRQVREAGLEDAVELTGRLPRPQALDILRRSTFAVVLAQAQRIQVPGKLYECVAMGVPTIVITEPDSATAEAGRAIGAFVFADGDVEGVARLLASSRPGEVSASLAGGDELSYQARTGSLEALMRRRLT